MKRILISCQVALILMGIAGAQQVIPLYPVANVPNAEKTTYGSSGELMMITDVADPSITVFLPDPAKATGTAVILCPGGAMRMLSWNNDVIKMAKWLNEKGIAAIGLKYRLVPGGMPKPDPKAAGGGMPPMAFMRNVTEFGLFEKANANPSTDTGSLGYIYKAAADAQEAVKLVRAHAAEWHVDPHKVGFLGFSAGGGVALAAVIRNTDPVTMPAFLATAYGPSLVDVIVPAGAPPAFICTNADHMNVAAGCMALFLEWKKAGVPAELHIFEKGKTGFSLDKSGTSSDMWSDAFAAWLKGEGLL